VLNEGTIRHLRIAHRRPIKDPIELSSQWYCGAVRLAHSICQRVVDVLVIHRACRRQTSNGVECHGWCLELDTLLSTGIWGNWTRTTDHIPEHAFPREAEVIIPFGSVQIKNVAI